MAAAIINSVSWPSNICRIDGDFAAALFCSREVSTGVVDFAGDEAFDRDSGVLAFTPGSGWGLAGAVGAVFFVDSFDSSTGTVEESGSVVWAAASSTNFNNCWRTDSFRASPATTRERVRSNAQCAKFALSRCSTPGSARKSDGALPRRYPFFSGVSVRQLTLKRKIARKNMGRALRRTPNIDPTYHNALRSLNVFRDGAVGTDDLRQPVVVVRKGERSPRG
jgi:hypothetical protein